MSKENQEKRVNVLREFAYQPALHKLTLSAIRNAGKSLNQDQQISPGLGEMQSLFENDLKGQSTAYISGYENDGIVIFSLLPEESIIHTNDKTLPAIDLSRGPVQGIDLVLSAEITPPTHTKGVAEVLKDYHLSVVRNQRMEGNSPNEQRFLDGVHLIINGNGTGFNGRIKRFSAGKPNIEGELNIFGEEDRPEISSLYRYLREMDRMMVGFHL